MIKDIIAERYAKALFDLAKWYKNADGVDQELGALVETAFSEQKHKTFWENPVVRTEKKMALLESVLGIYQMSKESNSFMRLLVRKGRFALLPLIHRHYKHLADEANKMTDVQVTAAVAPEPEAIERLRTTLEAKLQKQVRIQTEIDPALVGGLSVRIGNTVIDGSVKNSLNRMQDRIKRGSTR